MRRRMVQHGQKLLSLLPTNQFGIFTPAAACALQHAPVAQYQRSRNFSDDRVGKAFRMISGPIPDGSPMVTAMIGYSRM